MCMRFAAVLVGCRKYVVRWGDGIAGCGAKEERLGKRNWQKCLADRNRTSDRWMSAYYSTVHRSTNWATTSSRIPSVGIEPTTLGLLDPRSNQLSYEGEFCHFRSTPVCQYTLFINTFIQQITPILHPNNISVPPISSLYNSITSSCSYSIMMTNIIQLKLFFANTLSIYTSTWRNSQNTLTSDPLLTCIHISSDQSSQYTGRLRCWRSFGAMYMRL